MHDHSILLQLHACTDSAVNNIISGAGAGAVRLSTKDRARAQSLWRSLKTNCMRSKKVATFFTSRSGLVELISWVEISNLIKQSFYICITVHYYQWILKLIILVKINQYFCSNLSGIPKA